MALDRRKKICPNTECINSKTKFKANVKHCPECGAKLVYVCKERKCFKQIEDRGPSHALCDLCQAKHDDDAQARLDKVKAVAGTGGKAALGVVISVGAAVLSRVDKEVVDNLSDKAVDIVNRVLKK